MGPHSYMDSPGGSTPGQLVTYHNMPSMMDGHYYDARDTS